MSPHAIRVTIRQIRREYKNSILEDCPEEYQEKLKNSIKKIR